MPEILVLADVRNWKTNYNKTAGCTQIEIDGFNSQLNPGEGSGHKKLIDVWRCKLAIRTDWELDCRS
jgi:hypothetical protein